MSALNKTQEGSQPRMQGCMREPRPALSLELQPHVLPPTTEQEICFSAWCLSTISLIGYLADPLQPYVRPKCHHKQL